MEQKNDKAAGYSHAAKTLDRLLDAFPAAGTVSLTEEEKAALRMASEILSEKAAAQDDPTECAPGMKLLYDSRSDSRFNTAAALGRLHVPEHLGAMLFTRFNGMPEKAHADGYKGRCYRHETMTSYEPGLRIENLVACRVYERFQPCESLVLYYDGEDLVAEAGHRYGTSWTIIRFMWDKDYHRLWKYFGKDDRKSWYKLMKNTENIQDAIPDIMDLMRPCRLMPAGPD